MNLISGVFRRLHLRVGWGGVGWGERVPDAHLEEVTVSGLSCRRAVSSRIDHLSGEVRSHATERATTGLRCSRGLRRMQPRA